MPSAEPCVGREVIPESTLAARLALEEAAHLDPRSLRAWSQLATCYISDYKNRWIRYTPQQIAEIYVTELPNNHRLRA